MQSNNVNKSSIKVSLFIFVLILGFSVVYYINWKDVEAEEHNEINAIFSQSDHSYFAPVLPDSPLSFPKDYYEHASFQHEKWVMTVNGVNQKGESVGIQWTIFRISSDDRETKGWLDPRLYIAKVIITTKNKKWMAERLARGGIGQAGVNQRPYRVWIDDWQWRSLGKSPFPGVLSATSKDFSLKLSVNSNSKPVPLGDHGYSQKHDLLPVASSCFL